MPSTTVTATHVTQCIVEYESTIPRSTDEGLDLWEARAMIQGNQKFTHRFGWTASWDQTHTRWRNAVGVSQNWGTSTTGSHSLPAGLCIQRRRLLSNVHLLTWPRSRKIITSTLCTALFNKWYNSSARTHTHTHTHTHARAHTHTHTYIHNATGRFWRFATKMQKCVHAEIQSSSYVSYVHTTTTLHTFSPQMQLILVKHGLILTCSFQRFICALHLKYWLVFIYLTSANTWEYTAPNSSKATA